MPVPTSRNRRSIRLPGYDYTQPGAYFITLATFARAHLFGEVLGGKLIPTPLAKIVNREWFKTAQLRPYVTLYEDEFVIMPNHVHGIIHIDNPFGVQDVRAHDVRAQRCCAPSTYAPSTYAHTTYTPTTYASTDSDDRQKSSTKYGSTVVPASLGAIVRAFKSAVTYAAAHENLNLGGPIWQRNYYEHIIRDDADLARIQEYIAANPANWNDDAENVTP